MTDVNMKQQLELEKPLEIGIESADGILRRNNSGCKSEEFYNWPEQPFEQMDTPLAAQQYILQLVKRDPADIDKILQLPDGQDFGAWKIEHLRLFCMQLNRLAVKLQECCLPETCSQMTATEQWIFLCAAHKQPNECPAIDYTRHTLDHAASLLNSNKYFPSRVTIKESSVAKLGSVCRRVYRIFSHAYYHHYQIYEDFERETYLCERFSKFVTNYDLMPKDSLIVPSDGSKPIIEQNSTIDAANKSNSTDDEVTTLADTQANVATLTGSSASDASIPSEESSTGSKDSLDDIRSSSSSQIKVGAKKGAKSEILTNTTTTTPSATTIASPPSVLEKKTNLETAPTATATTTRGGDSAWSPSQNPNNTIVKSSPFKTGSANNTATMKKSAGGDKDAIKAEQS